MIQRCTTADKYRKLYSTKQWCTLRGRILTRDHYRGQRCGGSLTSGKSQPTSAVVHHKKPHKGQKWLAQYACDYRNWVTNNWYPTQQQKSNDHSVHKIALLGGAVFLERETIFWP